MSIIEQAVKRLEELSRAGVKVPWAAAGMADSEVRAKIDDPGQAPKEFELRLASGEAAPASTIPKVNGLPAANQPAPGSMAPLSERRSAHVTINLQQLERAGYLVPAQARSGLAEQFRHIKRPLLRNIADATAGSHPAASLIMVTSALPGEGKTFCAINLAMSLAMEIDRSVLLIDADVVRPRIAERMGLELGRGMLDVLEDPSINLADVILRTNVAKLSVLPAGTPNVRSTELLASGAMERMMLELASRYADRVIILDSPPLLLTTESRVLAARAGQVLIVVEAARTPRSAVAQAFATVESCPIVVSLLNRLEDADDGYYRGHYYG